jgi:hypothetical protein
MLHHTGKNGEQRGTSGHEDNIDSALLITRPKDCEDGVGCLFDTTVKKDRAFIAKGLPARLFLRGDGIQERLRLEVALESNLDAALEQLQLTPAMTCGDAVQMGFSSRTFYRARGILQDKGVIPPNSKPVKRTTGGV